MKTVRKVSIPVVAALAGAVVAGTLTGGSATATEGGDSAADRFAIREVIDRSQMYVDLKDTAAFANLFTKDGHYESPFNPGSDGRAEIEAAFDQAIETGFTKGLRHMTGPEKIDVNGSTATATSWYWIARNETEHSVYSTGTFTDKFRKVNGKWEIENRVQTIDAPAPTS
ncbi:nuclear transport factor 2 family protein [Streptomyces sp. NPDC058335]|uniref:nuclear transport factor 2 family protein n=1 Tax=Streptomyces sp. NPDC058335 TaxID=3346451 RepID=UPI0036508EF0